MTNDRKWRNGKEGSKNVKAGGRGRRSPKQADTPLVRAGSRSDGGRGGGSGGARGDRGHPQKANHGLKRATRSDSPNRAAGAAGGRRTQSPVANGKQVSVTRKKPKKGDVDAPSVIWSPGQDSGDEGSVCAQNLLSLASSFEGHYQEKLAMCENGADESGNVDTGHPAASRRGHGLSVGRGVAAAEATARSMSPARLEIQVQKARARAREERFGDSTKVSSISACVSRIVKTKIHAAPRTGASAGIRNQLSDAAAFGRGVENSTEVRLSEAGIAVPVKIPNQTPEATVATSIAESTSAAGASSVVREIGSRAASIASAITSPPAELSDVSCAATKPLDPLTVPIVPPIDTEEEGTYEPGEAAAGAKKTTSSKAEVPPRSETPPMTAPPKRNSPEEGNIAVIEPPTKKISTQPLKVFTLRLRLRSEVTAGVEEHVPDGGVEESKGFDPPNPPRDSGVEECKGFDPPNLPPMPVPESPPGPALAQATAVKFSAIAAPKATQGPSLASSVDPAAAAETPATTGKGSSSISDDLSVTSAITRPSSWGPSFGIFRRTEAASSIVPAQPAAAPANPWIIAPGEPTFARNQGRPMARSFLLPATSETRRPERKPGSSQGIATTVSFKGKGRRDTVAARRCADEVGDRSSRGASGHDIAVVSKPRPLTDTRPPAPVSVDVRDRTRDDPDNRPHQTVLPGSDAPQVQASQPQDMVALAVAAWGVSAEAAGETTAAGANPDEAAQQGLSFEGRAGRLLEKLKREREESLKFENKLAKALMDL